MAGVALETDVLDLAPFTEALRQQARIVLLAVGFEHAEAAFDHFARPFLAARRRVAPRDAALAARPRCSRLIIPPGAGLRERQQPARQRAGDPERIRGLPRQSLISEARRPRTRTGRSCRARGSRAFPAECNVAAPMRNITSMPATIADEQLASARSVRLRHREGRQRHVALPDARRARMAQIVELKGMRESAERQAPPAARASVRRAPGSRHGPPPRSPAPHPAPSADHGNSCPKIGARDGIDQAILGVLDDATPEGPRSAPR